MTQTIHLTAHSLTATSVHLQKPDGSKFDVPVQDVPAKHLNKIKLALENRVANLNGSGQAPVKVIANVEVDNATGRYLSITVIAVSIEND